MQKLNNNHNVYILGAGFSADRGLPTIKDFMLAMRDAHEWLAGKGRNREAEAIAEVLDFRFKAASAAYRVKLDLENIEELFSFASASSSGTLNDKIQLAIAATLDFRVSTHNEPKISFRSNENIFTLPDSWVKTSNGFDTSCEIECPAYEFYIKSLIGNWDNQNNFDSNSIISFNYDLLAEDALTRLSIPYDYGMETQKKNPATCVELLKLHGSVNWSENDVNPENYVIHKSYEELLAKGLTPQLVPPTWKKIFNGPLHNIWEKSLKSLEKATRIIVIGFSMPNTDNHFKYLMAAGLQDNISLREVIFINPAKEYLAQRTKELFGDSLVVGQVSATEPIVKVIGCNLASFLSQGNVPNSIGYYGRPLPKEFQNIHLR